MTATPHILESALLLLAAFFIGCLVGHFARRVFGRPASATPVSAGTSAPAPGSEASVSKRSALPEEPALAARPRTRSRKARVADDVAASRQVGSAGLPNRLQAPRNGQPDNLRRIKGIGPAMEARLHQAGIFHIDQIAGWNRKAAGQMDAELGAGGRIEREKWVTQAKALVKSG